MVLVEIVGTGQLWQQTAMLFVNATLHQLVDMQSDKQTAAFCVHTRACNPILRWRNICTMDGACLLYSHRLITEQSQDTCGDEKNVPAWRWAHFEVSEAPVSLERVGKSESTHSYGISSSVWGRRSYLQSLIFHS